VPTHRLATRSAWRCGLLIAGRRRASSNDKGSNPIAAQHSCRVSVLHFVSRRRPNVDFQKRTVDAFQGAHWFQISTSKRAFVIRRQQISAFLSEHEPKVNAMDISPNAMAFHKCILPHDGGGSKKC
jgi:hypothetical protein